MKKGFVIGLAMGLTLAGVSVALASSQIQAILNDQIKLSINGEIKQMSDATTGQREYPLTYKDRTYIPLRSVATLLGMNVDYDEITNTALINSPKDVNIKIGDTIDFNDCSAIEEITGDEVMHYYIVTINNVKYLVDANRNILLKQGEEANLVFDLDNSDYAYYFESIKSKDAIYYVLDYEWQGMGFHRAVYTSSLKKITDDSLKYVNIDESGNLVCVSEFFNPEIKYTRYLREATKDRVVKYNQNGGYIYGSDYYHSIEYTDGNYIIFIDENKKVKVFDIIKNETIEVATHTGNRNDLNGDYECRIFKNEKNSDIIDIWWPLDYDNEARATKNVTYHFNIKTHEVTEEFGYGR